MQQARTRMDRNCFKVVEAQEVKTSKPPDLTPSALIRETGRRSGEMRIISQKKKALPETNLQFAEMKVQRVCNISEETGEKGENQKSRKESNFHTEPILSLEDKGPQSTNSKFHEIKFHPNGNTFTFKDNPTLLNKSSMNRLQLIIYMGMMSGALAWRWDGTNQQILRLEGGFLKFWWIQWCLITFQTICLTGFQLWVFMGFVERTVTGFREVFMSSLLVYWCLFACVFRLLVYMSQDKMRCYINSMLLFNRIHVEKYLLHLKGYKQGGKIVMNLSIPLTCCQILTSLSFFIIFPTQPWYLTSYLPHKDWYWLIPGAMQDVVVLASDITIYMLMAWMIVAHAITVGFWLRESHKSKSNTTYFTSEEIRKPLRATGIHRALSVLNASFNDCMAGLPISNLKLTIMSGAIICGYVMVRSMNHLFMDEFPSILIYPVGIINCLATAFGFISMSAQVNELGRSFVDSWRQTNDKNLQRILRSCSTIKVWVGRFYYVSVGTIATFFAIIVDQITNCILTFP